MKTKKGEHGALMVDREPLFDVFMFDSDPPKCIKTDCKSDTDMHFPTNEGEMVADVTFFAKLVGMGMFHQQNLGW